MATIEHPTAKILEPSPIPILEQSPPMEPALETLDLPQQGQEVGEVLPTGKALVANRRNAMRYALSGVLAIPATMMMASAAVQSGQYAYNRLKPKPTFVYPPPAFESNSGLSTSGEVTLERNGNTTIVHYPDGSRHYILYNTHTPRSESGRKRSNLEKAPDRLPDDLDGIVIETARERWSRIPHVAKFAYDHQYEAAMQCASENNIPIILAQPFLCGTQTGRNRGLFEVGSFATGVAGLALHARNKIRNVAEGRDDFSRRSFMRNSAIPVMVASVLTQPIVATLSRILSTKADSGNLTAGTNEFLRNGQTWVHHLFPEQKVTAALLAEKVEWLMKEKGMKNVATIIGADHTELETFSRMSHDKRIAFLEANRQILQDSVDPESVSGMQFMRARTTKFAAANVAVNTNTAWNPAEIFHVPHLQDGMHNLTGIKDNHSDQLTCTD